MTTKAEFDSFVAGFQLGAGPSLIDSPVSFIIDMMPNVIATEVAAALAAKTSAAPIEEAPSYPKLTPSAPVAVETPVEEPTLSDLPTTAWPDPVPVAEPNDATAI